MQLNSDSRSDSAYRVVTRTSVVANEEQKGCTVLSSRNDIGSKPNAVITARPIARWPSSGNGPSPRPPLASADGRDQRHELALEPVEDALHLGRRRSRLEVVEEDVVRIVGRLEARDVLALQLELPVEPRPEGGVVVLLARDDPRLHALGRRLGQLAGEVGRDAPRLLPVAARDADQAGVVGVVGKGGLEVAQLVDELADPVVAEPLVGDPLDRREPLGADRGTRRRHHHHLIPVEQRKRRAEVGHFTEPEP